MEGAEAVVRVERGRVGADELAALTAALFLVCGRGREVAGRPPPAVPGWAERVADYRAPGGWR